MKFKNFFNSDSPMQDRMLRISNEDDLDDDLSGGGAGGASGLSLEDEHEEDDDFSDEEGDTGAAEGDEGNEAEDGDDGESGIDYKQRYTDTKTDRDHIKSERDQYLEEIGKLKAEVKSFDKSDEDNEALERQYGDDLYTEIAKISEDDPNRAKKVYAEIGKNNARMRKEILDEVDNRNQAKSKTVDQEAQRKEQGFAFAKIALKEVGLNPEKTINLFQKEVDTIMADDPNWFKAIPADSQFIRIANKVLEKVKSNKQKNEEHRMEAGGMLSSGSKVKPKAGSQDDDDAPDTMIGAMGAVRSSQRRKAKNRSRMVGR